MTKPWPKNTNQIFCSRRDDPKRVPVPDPRDAVCADCGLPIVVAGNSLRVASENYPLLTVRLLCVECGVQYELPDVLIDLRGQQKAD